MEIGLGWDVYATGPHVHVVPHEDIVAHEFSPKCVCKPKWNLERVMNVEGLATAWLFTHNAADGRPE